jgi:leucine-rich repeat protein SHOC2
MPAPDADLDAEPEVLMCPITRAMFRDPVMVVESGHTYERDEITQHFAHSNRDPKTNLPLRSTRVVTNWGLRAAVEEWLNCHPDVTPDGWDSRELRPVQVEAPVQTAQAGHGDVLVLQMWRDMCPELQAIWEVDRPPEQWRGVTMEDGRVVRLQLSGVSLSQVVPACIVRLTALQALDLSRNQLTNLPAEIGQLTSLNWLNLHGNQLTSVPAEIGQLTSLGILSLSGNQLTSVPAEIGQLTSLRELNLSGNRLTSLPAEIGQLTSLVKLYLDGNQLTSLPAEIGQLTSLTASNLDGNQLTSLPAEIGQLTLLEQLALGGNRLTSVPAEIGQLTSLRHLWLGDNQLTTLPAAIHELRAAGCYVRTDDGMTVDE